MLGSRSETPLFDRYSAVNSDKYEAELCRVLRDAFAIREHRLSSKQLMQQIAYNSNYSVEIVTRVMNKQHYRMQRSFAENYGIHATRTVYHGTSQEGAKSIETVGFKASAGRRAKFGKGIYSSPVVWEALGYAKPYNDARQVFFVVELLQGPTALGSEDQFDFGVDATGSEILTLRNPEETVLCASKENQMLATYRITMRYMFEGPFLLRHRECVRIVHPDIAVLIKARANADAAAAAAAAARPREAIHPWLQVGHKVHVKQTLQAYCEFVDKPGVICRIVKAPRFLFCVRLDDATLRTTAQRLNALPENRARFPFLTTNDDDLVVLRVDQLERYTTKAEAQAAQPDRLLGKRKAQRST